VPGFVPGIQVFSVFKAWMAGTKGPAMTNLNQISVAVEIADEVHPRLRLYSMRPCQAECDHLL